jgi:hypothetical protein
MAASTPESGADRDQVHPLQASDRETVDGLLAVEKPGDDHLVDAARLLIRYDGFPGATDLRQDLVKAITHWGLDRAALEARCRALWQGGFRPGRPQGDQAVGSGFDTDAAADR